MAATIRIFRLTSQHGRKSLLFQISSQRLTKQICAPLSTSACSQNVVRKLIPDEGLWAKNKKIERPMSPCVTICSAPLSTSACSQNVMRKIIPDEGFWAKNKRMERPMSPHVTIYRFPLPAVMSITHRFTGLGWSALIAGVGVSALLVPGESAAYIQALKSLDLPLWVLAPGKFILVWPLVYHTYNGLRHLVWDSGHGLHLSSIYSTGAAIIGVSIITSIGIVAYCC